jgi:oligo-1,6-glucosidase
MKIFAILIVSVIFGISCQSSDSKNSGHPLSHNEGKSVDSSSFSRKWWKEAVVYQIYPRSFKDGNQNGIGDIKGIISKLDYIKSLGITVVWLNPIYSSPNIDGGYDISDYENINPDFGTMQDFDSLLTGLHKRGIKLVMDLVVNHSSDQHHWFEESRKSRNNPYRDYYHWWPAEKGLPQHRWSFFDVNQDAWMYDKTTNAYYLHYFARAQPDLKWENPKVRDEIFTMMNYWFKKGVDGFRMDVIPFISKDTTFPPLPEKYKGNFVDYYAHGPKVHEYLKEMYQKVMSRYDVMTVGEGIGLHIEDAQDYVADDRKELNMFFQFESIGLGKGGRDGKYADPKGYKLTDFKRIFSKWDSVFEKRGWGTVYLGNHDQSRMQSRFGNDKPEFRNPSSKLLFTFLLSMRATPYVYFGDEIGMSNIRFTDIHDYRDLETLNYYEKVKKEGGDLNAFLKGQAEVSRDNGRTPMQWDSSPNAGFSTVQPWIKVNPNYLKVNVQESNKDSSSILNYFRKMVQLRKDHLSLVYGRYTLLDTANTSVYSYTRTLASENDLVVMNFTDKPVLWNIPSSIVPKNLLIGNYPSSPNSIKNINGSNILILKPYEAKIYQIQ